jgi:hypothetical protein
MRSPFLFLNCSHHDAAVPTTRQSRVEQALFVESRLLPFSRYLLSLCVQLLGKPKFHEVSFGRFSSGLPPACYRPCPQSASVVIEGMFCRP